MNRIVVFIVLVFIASCTSGNKESELGNKKVEKTFFPDGALQKETHFGNDGQISEITKYFEDGTVSSHATYYNGKYVGEAVIYYPNGQKNFVQNYDSLGRPEGVYALYSKEGILMETGNYMNGQREGEWKTFDESGKLTSDKLYQNGKEVVDFPVQ